MTRKHFEAIAANFATQVSKCKVQDKRCGSGTQLEALYELALRMCETFRQMNDRFDSDRFLTACGF